MLTNFCYVKLLNFIRIVQLKQLASLCTMYLVICGHMELPVALCVGSTVRLCMLFHRRQLVHQVHNPVSDPMTGTTEDWAKGAVNVAYSYNPMLAADSPVVEVSYIQPAFDYMWASIISLIGQIQAIEGPGYPNNIAQL